MSGLGFSRGDFAIFTAEGAGVRMQQILGRLQPRLSRLGREMTPDLGRVMRTELFPHVARHVHQSLTPPRETWVAWGHSPRSYARHGFLVLSVSACGLHARAAVRVQADNRQKIGRGIAAAAGDLTRSFGNTRLARYDTWQSDAVPPPPQQADRTLFNSLGAALARKSAVLDVGFGWPVREALHLDRADLIDAFRELEPLYRILRASA